MRTWCFDHDWPAGNLTTYSDPGKIQRFLPDPPVRNRRAGAGASGFGTGSDPVSGLCIHPGLVDGHAVRRGHGTVRPPDPHPIRGGGFARAEAGAQWFSGRGTQTRVDERGLGPAGGGALDPGADTKGIAGRVAGRANVLIVPNIETGNVIWKSITVLNKQQAAGVVVGGSCPIVLPSRSDDWETKLRSVQFARLLLKKSL